MKANAEIEVLQRRPQFYEEHYELYRNYQNWKHPGGVMAVSEPKEYLDYMASSWSETVLYEFREKRQLLAVAIVDHLLDGLSAVYTFYAPSTEKRSMGTYCVLWQIYKAARLGTPFVYLGYWIGDCSKMSYKNKFKPYQQHTVAGWG